MTSPTLRIGLALLLAISLATAAAQSGGAAQGAAGITFNWTWTAQVDALVLDVPPEATEVTQVAARGEGDVDAALLTLEHGAAGGAHLRGTLPDLHDSPLLLPITSEELWPCPMQASSDARFAPFPLRAVGAPAAIELANAPLPDPPTLGYRQLLLVFADTYVRVHGACLEAPTALQVDLYLRPGWNLVTSELTTVGDVERVLLRASGPSDLDGVAWRWRDDAAR